MRRCFLLRALAIAVLIVSGAAIVAGQLDQYSFTGSLDHPAIEYTTRPASNLVTDLAGRIEGRQVRLQFDSGTGYLRSVLDALNVPAESQMLVFSKTAVQQARINPGNPRALFFADSVAVGYVRGTPFLEFAVDDPQQGVIFYTLPQTAGPPPRITRNDGCLLCHESYASLDVPGMLVRSNYTARDGKPLPQIGTYLIDHRSPFEQRWGGWYVTGNRGSIRHMGNAMVLDQTDPGSMITDETLNVASLDGRFDTHGYLSPYSDIVALMVFEHEMRMINLLTRVGWETRVAAYEHRLDFARGPLHDAVTELVDYLLFVDETPLTAKVQGSSGFAEKFSARGPRDARGRSLRDLDLTTRLMRYPCSFLIYSDAFNGLPAETKDAIFQRMWQVLSGQDGDRKYDRLSISDRQAIVGILRETNRNIPPYFREDEVGRR